MCGDKFLCSCVCVRERRYCKLYLMFIYNRSFFYFALFVKKLKIELGQFGDEFSFLESIFIEKKLFCKYKMKI